MEDTINVNNQKLSFVSLYQVYWTLLKLRLNEDNESSPDDLMRYKLLIPSIRKAGMYYREIFPCRFSPQTLNLLCYLFIVLI